MPSNPDRVEEPLARLIAAHPVLFRGKEPAISSFLPEGWYALVDRLCSDMEATLGPQGCAAYEVRQVKEKFGALRFYYRLQGEGDLYVDLKFEVSRSRFVKPAVVEGADRIRALIEQAMADSEHICQRCGCAGSLRNLGGWHVTLCEPHSEEHANHGDGTATGPGA